MTDAYQCINLSAMANTRSGKCERYTRVSIDTLRYILAECTLADDVREGLEAMLADAKEALE